MSKLLALSIWMSGLLLPCVPALATDSSKKPAKLYNRDNELIKAKSVGAQENPDKFDVYAAGAVPLGNLLVFMPAIEFMAGASYQYIGFELGGYAMENFMQSTSAYFMRGTIQFEGVGDFQSMVRIGIAKESIEVREQCCLRGADEGRLRYRLTAQPPAERAIGRNNSTGINLGFGFIVFDAPITYGINFFDVTMHVATRSEPINGISEDKLREEGPNWSARIGSAFFGFSF